MSNADFSHNYNPFSLPSLLAAFLRSPLCLKSVSWRTLLGFLCSEDTTGFFTHVNVYFWVTKTWNELRRSVSHPVLGRKSRGAAGAGASVSGGVWRRGHGKGPSERSCPVSSSTGPRVEENPVGMCWWVLRDNRSPRKGSRSLWSHLISCPGQLDAAALQGKIFGKGPSLAAVTSAVKGWRFSVAMVFLSPLFKSQDSGMDWEGGGIESEPPGAAGTSIFSAPHPPVPAHSIHIPLSVKP